MIYFKYFVLTFFYVVFFLITFLTVLLYAFDNVLLFC